MTWVLKNKNLFGWFAWAVNIPLIIALIFTPTLVGKWKGMYKLNMRGYMLAVIGRALVVVAGYLTQGKHVDGTMYSCTSLGVKIGGGIGTAIVGWLMELSGYVGKNTTQPQSALDMMQFMYLWLPLFFDVLILVILSKMNVEAENERIKLQQGIGSDIRHEL